MVKQRWINGVLVVSLALNLMVAGAILGRWFKDTREHRGPLAWAIKTLDTNTRERLRPILEQNRGATRELRRRIRTASDDVRDAISAEPFDEARLARALENLRAVTGQYQAVVHTVALETLGKLPADERERVGALLLRPGQLGGRHREGMPHRPAMPPSG